MLGFIHFGQTFLKTLQKTHDHPETTFLKMPECVRMVHDENSEVSREQ